jgi:hypothetical protein
LKNWNNNVTDLQGVVLDPSILMAPSHILFDIIVRKTSIVGTDRMWKLIWPDSRSVVDNELFALLRLWGGRAEHMGLSIAWVRENVQTRPRNPPLPLDSIFDNFKTQHLIGPLRKYLLDGDSKVQLMGEEIVHFVADEICLALQYSVPILCTETSSHKIVEVLKKIGANVKTNPIQCPEDKKNLLKDNSSGQVLAVAAGVALVYMWGGPNGGLESLGTEGITAAVTRYV